MAESKPKIKKNEYTLESGRKILLKTISLDLRDELLDKVEFIFDDNNKLQGVSAMQKTITHWMRNMLEGDTSDEFLYGFTMDERTEFFRIVQGNLFMGEGKPSN